MIQRAVRGVGFGVMIAVVLASTAVAGGLYGGVPFYTLDLSSTYTQIPVAMDDASSVLAGALAGMGFSPIEVAAILDGFDEATGAVEQTLGAVPDLVPVPLIGGGFEIGLPMLIVDGLRFSFGFLGDSLIRGLAEASGSPIPQPLFQALFDVNEIALVGSASVDCAFSSWMLSTEVVKRLDLFLLGITLGGGIDIIQGRVTPILDIDVPAEYQTALSDALAALRIDAFSWSAFAAHVGIGFEVGPPFLRLYGDLRFLLPMSQAESWWGVHVGGFAGLVGFAILF